MIECEPITKVKNELDAAFSQYEQDLKEYGKKIQNEFQTEWSKKKFKWFFKKYRQRKLKSKIYRRHCRLIFELVDDILEDVLPKAIEFSFDQFADIKDIVAGDKHYFVNKSTVDKFNSLGCTSFNLTPNEIKQIKSTSENDFIEKCHQDIIDAGSCTLLKED